MPTLRRAIPQFCAYVQRHHDAAHTVDSYTLDLQRFSAHLDKPLAKISFRDIERFIDQQHQQHFTPATINRRLYALTHVCDVLLAHHMVSINPVKPSHVLRRGSTRPRALPTEQLDQWFAHIRPPMDRALFLLMRRCGLRVSEVARLTVRDIDWTQHALLIEQGKGRKDRRVYLSEDAVAGLRECLRHRPSGVPGEAVCWNQQRSTRPLSVKAIQKTMERYAKAAGIVASCHQLRHTFASNWLEQGAELVSIRELLGHASMTSSERDAKVSNPHVKQVDVKTMRKIIQQSKV